MKPREEMFNIIPAIDILDGKLVRLKQGNYQKIETFDYTPLEMAKMYQDHGATRIHIVDLDGAKDGRLVNEDLITNIRQNISCTLEFGGGVRTKETVSYLLNIGIDFVILGSLLIKNPSLSAEIITSFPDHIIAGIDAKDDFVATEGWIENSQLSSTELIHQLNPLPLSSIIYTDIARDGMMQGPNIKSLLQHAKESHHPIIASGGIRDHTDIEQLKQLSIDGIVGCVIGKAILSKSLSMSKLWKT